MDVSITVADGHDPESAGERLKALGLTEVRVHAGIGLITGSFEGDPETLRGVEGVESVDPSLEVHIQEDT